MKQQLCIIMYNYIYIFYERSKNSVVKVYSSRIGLREILNYFKSLLILIKQIVHGSFLIILYQFSESLK